MIYVIYFHKEDAYYQKRRVGKSLTDNVYACEHYSQLRTAQTQAAKLQCFPYSMGPNEIRTFEMRRYPHDAD